MSTPVFDWTWSLQALKFECIGPFCNGGFLPDMRYVYEPWEWLYEKPSPFVVRDNKFLVLGDRAVHDETLRFSELVPLIESGAFVFVPRSGDPVVVAEPSQEDFVLGVLVPKPGSGHGMPMRVVMRDGTAKIEWPERDFGEASSLALISDLGRALYSAREDVVYIVGGEGCTAEASLRRFSFAESSTTTFEEKAVPEGEVAGAAFDPVNNRIFLLFIDRDTDSAMARLVLIEPGRPGDSKDLLAVPYDPANRRVALTMGPSGTVVLVSERANELVVAWMFEIEDSGPRLVGSWDTVGSLLGVSHPSFPIVVITTDENTRVVHLERSDFESDTALVGL